MGNLKGAITCLETANLKPNFSALGREYGLDRRTTKKKYLGITNKKKRKKESKFKRKRYYSISLKSYRKFAFIKAYKDSSVKSVSNS